MNNINYINKNKSESEFIGYEYNEVVVSKDMESIYTDGYTNFGWELDNISRNMQPNSTTLKFKRDRKIRNKAELTRLQRKFDAITDEIESLERSKVITAATVAYVIGIVGTAFMAGSVFAVVGGNIPLTILLAIPGFIGWIIPYIVYKNLKKKKIIQLTPIIDEKYDDIYSTTKDANSLLFQ